MTATDPFRLTGDSHADLDRMERAFRHDDRMEANACAPGPTGPVAEAQRRARVQLDALATLIGPAALMLLTDAVGDLHYAGADYRARTIMLEETTIRLGNQVDVARNLAARLEEEVARLTDPWIGRYLQALEDAVGEDRLGEVQQAASEAWRAAGSPMLTVEPVAVAMPDPGLPIVDDASLPEHAIQFLRADGSAIAVGVLERVFGPLDQAAQIAVGAVPTDLPGEDAAHPLDDLDDAIAHGADLVTWPDGTQFRLDPDGSWQLIATSQHEGRWAHVATPTADRSAGSRRVDIGSSWGPYGDPTEAPRPAPPGPADPPRPPHHRPYA